ncbi:methyltransferase domain-containing protein [Horticoccus luteus]|uniref:Methyltransferase domain-containing protein n=1 Tax=Horticoccus luteus TaxID=2862869 RepID=A0A8F9XM13_9BACT|nr:class I SAM-dependent methyltransferase [Horticoccus luteus]QYM79781.1 methyltransferase domain-containing protein [Horticoccus luteus]
MNNPQWPHPGNLAEFSFSKLSHFELFRDLPFQSYNVGDPDPTICDLKVYQDYLVYLFIRNNVPPGSRLLEVGGGDSRVLRFLSRDYECWNADKCEGLGNGPTKFISPDYRIVYDYMGSFSPELSDGYFDFVFSISALEHTPEDPTIRENILKDMNRVLKPGGYSLHCFDAILRPGGTSWINGLVPYLYSQISADTLETAISTIQNDANCYVMSQQAYDSNWKPITKDDYSEFGRPFSINVGWPQRSSAR